MNVSISVVIPTADRGEMLCRCLQSVLLQTLAPLEILLVDNGYSDADVGQYKDFVSIIRSEPRIGPSRARNLGAQQAKGDYISFLDDDDIWGGADYLQQVVNKINESSADAVLAQLMRDSGSGGIKPYKLFPNDVQEQRRVFFSNPGFGGQNLTIRRKLFLELKGFDETMPASEDRDLAARLLIADRKMVSQAAAHAVLCDHDGSRARDNMVEGNLAFLKKHWRHMTRAEFRRARKVYYKRLSALLQENR